MALQRQETPFDTTAQGYDLEFTETQVGRLQRAVTHRYLHDLILSARPKTVLELNCGTGEDALWMANQGLQVTATDLSAEMVKATAKKVQGKDVQVFQAGIQDMGVAEMSEGTSYPAHAGRRPPTLPFDLIWSNFGGFNCLPPQAIQQSSADLAGLLKPGGHLVAVVMGRFCAWETLYFLAKFNPRQAFRRRKKGPVKARLADHVFQDTWYYSPAQFEGLFQAHFTPVQRIPIGAYLPPSYLDPFFAQRPNLLARMNRWEARAYTRRFPALFSDHFLVAFRRR
jgi:SAM-dependent methyltransferase